MKSRIPIFVIACDRLEVLKKSICSYRDSFGDSFELVIHDSHTTYPPTLAYLRGLEQTGVKVYRYRTPNRRSNFTLEVLVGETVKQWYQENDAEYFVITDPDIAFDQCPRNILEIFQFFLRQFPEIDAVGPMLRIDDIPDHYPLKMWVLKRYKPFWEERPRSVRFQGISYEYKFAEIATTFALYRKEFAGRYRKIKPGIRVYAPCWARHLDWYIDPRRMTRDQVYYLEHAGKNAHWSAGYLRQVCQRDLLPPGEGFFSRRSRLKNLVLSVRGAAGHLLRAGQLSGLFGWRATLRLYRAYFGALRSRTPVNALIDSLVRKMAVGSCAQGSSCPWGWVYHDFPLPEILPKVHRKAICRRLSELKKIMPLREKTVLDLGCASGGISLGLALLGAAKVTGVDHDEVAVRLAGAVAGKYAVSNVEFHCADLSDFEIPRADVVVWLSQWMWLVRQRGLEYGKKMLFDVPFRSGAKQMVFESAAQDGKAKILGLTQNDIAELLRSWTPFTDVRETRAFHDGWRPSGKERMVFICSKPRLVWESGIARVTRVDAYTVIKEYRESYLWSQARERECLKRLAAFPYFPKILEEGKGWVKMEWAGYGVTKASPLHQLDDITRILARTGIVHRDIRKVNLLCREGRLYLVDFGWAIIDGREVPVAVPKGLGRSFYEFGRWDDRTAAQKLCNSSMA